MEKKTIIYTVIGAVLLFVFLYGAYLLVNKPKKKQVKTNEIILYWGENCPHCKNVEDYLKSHPDIEKKIKIERKEVYNNKASASDLEDKANICQYEYTTGIPVPFFYYKGECTTGDKPIIDFLTNKTK